MQKYELYLNGKLVEQYNGPTEGREFRIGYWKTAPAANHDVGHEQRAWRYDPSRYTEFGNCCRVLLHGEGCGL
jgi:hypothetical protein